MNVDNTEAFFAAFDVGNVDLVNRLLIRTPELAHKIDDKCIGWTGLHRLIAMAMDQGVSRRDVLNLVALFRQQERKIYPPPNTPIVNCQTPEWTGVDEYCLSPAHIAAQNGDAEILMKLLEPNEDIDSSSNSNSFEDHMSESAVSDLWLRTNDGRTVMHHAANASGMDDFFENYLGYYLKNEPAEPKKGINDQDVLGRTLLMVAAFRGNSRLVRLLLQQPGIRCDLTDSDECNFLHYLFFDNDNNSELLSSRKAIVESYLHHLGEDRREFFKLLSSKTVAGQTPLDYVYFDSQDSQLIALLDQAVNDNLSIMIQSLNNEKDNLSTKHLLAWLENMQQTFNKMGSTDVQKRNKVRLVRLMYHTQWLQSKLHENPDDQAAIAQWVINTQDDLRTQKVRDTWKLLLMVVLAIAIMAALGFAITLAAIHAPVIIAATTVAEITQGLWVFTALQAQLLLGVTTGSAVLGGVVGGFVSMMLFFSETKQAKKMLAEASSTKSEAKAYQSF